MNDNPFLRFIDLVTFDQKIQSLENDIVSVDSEIVLLKKQEDAFAHDLDEAHKRVNQLKKRVDEHELEMKVLDQKEKDKKQLLDRLSDYKEYQGIKAEVEAIQRTQVEQEQTVLDAWNQLENAQTAEKKKKIESVDLLKQLHDQREQLDHKVAQLRVDAADFLAQRAEKESSVPAEWLEKYTMMRARVSDPVVEIFHQSCGACSQMITSQDFVRAKRGALIQCQKCYRLLYAPEIMEMHNSK
jgi:predicted  nucleic acid-binding Zn-ribbon protein